MPECEEIRLVLNGVVPDGVRKIVIGDKVWDLVLNVEIRLIRGSEVLAVPMEKSQFNFENFERLTGRWTMPKGFTPQYIEVRISGSVPVAKRFNWARGEAVEAPSAFISEIPQVQPNAQ